MYMRVPFACARAASVAHALTVAAVVQGCGFGSSWRRNAASLQVVLSVVALNCSYCISS